MATNLGKRIAIYFRRERLPSDEWRPRIQTQPRLASGRAVYKSVLRSFSSSFQRDRHRCTQKISLRLSRFCIAKPAARFPLLNQAMQLRSYLASRQKKIDRAL